MKPERAQEILRLGAQWSEYRKHMTPDEVAYTLELWNRMPGTTCFYDAIVRIAKREPHVHSQMCYALEHGVLLCGKDEL